MKKEFITTIIQDFDNKTIPKFFDLKEYETDYEISRHFSKMLRIGYIKKEDVNSPEKAIYINFKRKYFSVSVFCKKGIAIIEKDNFRDYYQNYDTVEKVYQKVLLVCKNTDLFKEN